MLVTISFVGWFSLAAAQESDTSVAPQATATPAAKFERRGAFVPMPARAPAQLFSGASCDSTELMLRVVDAHAGDVVADLGCGDGRHSLELARQLGKSTRLLCRDVSATAIQELATKARAMGLTNVDAAVSEAGDAKLPGGEVDVALLSDVDHGLSLEPDATRAAFLHSLFAGLRPGGVAVVCYGAGQRTLRDFIWAGFEPGRRFAIGDGTPLTCIEFRRPAGPAASIWWDLFDGRSLSGWSSWLGPQVPGGPPLAASDPQHVFSVQIVDGEPAIRVSGENWGLLATTDEWEDYELELECKWGSVVWPPLNARDSGVLYHIVGPDGAVAVGGGPLADPPGSGWFPRAFELQLTESDAGSFYALGDLVADVESANRDGIAVWKEGGVRRAVGGSHGPGAALKSADRARPIDQWNLLQIRACGRAIAHRVNGADVVNLISSRRVVADGEAPHARGRIALQSESAEIFFRRIRVRPSFSDAPAGDGSADR